MSPALRALARELAEADRHAATLARTSVTPDADTAAGVAAGYAAGLRRAVELLGAELEAEEAGV